MEWDKDAEEAVARVPFFVRKRVRKKVEAEAARAGAKRVNMAQVRTCQQRFLRNQEAELKGYQLETCFGPGGCERRIDTGVDLVPRLETLLAGHQLKEFMKSRVAGPLKMHHEFRLTMADCANGCSRPQIVDIGLIAAALPQCSGAPCSGCGACQDACPDAAITLHDPAAGPAIDPCRCLACGQCGKACPTGAIANRDTGFRILLGGKLGRHPQLGRELAGIFSPAETLAVVAQCLLHFKAENQKGERFGEILNRTGLAFLAPHTPRGA
ncbi:4Fe-4S dicluster domain-containing protein [Thiovibrio sp. JS02]